MAFEPGLDQNILLNKPLCHNIFIVISDRIIFKCTIHKNFSLRTLQILSDFLLTL